MANPEHLEILKQGVEVWNEWRKEQPFDNIPDLEDANLSGMDLRGFNLGQSWLVNANLQGVNLSSAYVANAALNGVDLTKAHMIQTNLSKTELLKACFLGVDLSLCSFNGANLTDADFRETRLLGVDFSRSTLERANFTNATFVSTILGDTNLNSVIGLEACFHQGPSILDMATLARSGMLPIVFLRGCGVPDIFIEYLPSFVNQPIQFYSCFISYSHKDGSFAQRLHADLQQKGVRCWFAPKDMKIGDKIRHTIDQSIRIHDKLLLILSENSLNSEWVESEVEKAFEEERQRKQTVLFPVRLDEAVMETDQPWAAEIRRTRHIGDFTRWKDHDAYQLAFERLLRDLKAEE